MKKLITITAIAGACIAATPAEAHCPNACRSDWHYYKASELGVPATGTVTNAHIRTAVEMGLSYDNSIEGMATVADAVRAGWMGYAPTTLSQSRTSSTSGYAITFADWAWRYTPRRLTWMPYTYVHQGQFDRGSFYGGAFNARVRYTMHSSKAH